MAETIKATVRQPSLIPMGIRQSPLVANTQPNLYLLTEFSNYLNTEAGNRIIITSRDTSAKPIAR